MVQQNSTVVNSESCGNCGEGNVKPLAEKSKQQILELLDKHWDELTSFQEGAVRIVAYHLNLRIKGQMFQS